MQTEDRVIEIEQKYAHLVEDILILNLTDETLKIILKLHGGTTLRVAERWQSKVLVRYSYYWLDSENKLKIGWDNAPHHKDLNNFPHHKHLGQKEKISKSNEICLEDVMLVVQKSIT